MYVWMQYHRNQCGGTATEKNLDVFMVKWKYVHYKLKKKLFQWVQSYGIMANLQKDFSSHTVYIYIYNVVDFYVCYDIFWPFLDLFI